MYFSVLFLIILAAGSGSSSLFLTRLIRTPQQQQQPLPLSQWPEDLATANQVVFRPLFLYKHKQEEKKLNKEQKRKEQAENLELHLLDHQYNPSHHYFYDPYYYYYYYQQYYNRPDLFKSQSTGSDYSNSSNDVRRQQLSYKT